MTRLSRPPEALETSYDVIVVGSGYGGGIAASRLARAGRRVCVLERGKELQPGEYPRTALELLDQVQTDWPLGHQGPATGLFDIRYNHDVNVVLGCGLGGTSLINAGIVIRPEPRIFQDPHWPAEIRNDEAMDRYFGHVEAMLEPATYPRHSPRLARLEALRHCAESLEAQFELARVLVNFTQRERDVNHVGVEERPCIGCGDCISGCNYHAKKTVLTNYLPDAVNYGAQIFTEVCARSLERRGERWLVRYRDGRREREGIVSGDVVVLAGGTLGSTEILLRSAAEGLPLSDALGSRFSANGDMVGFVYNVPGAMHGVGLGARQPREVAPVGPCSTGLIDVRGRGPLEEGMVMVEAAIPGACATFLPALLGAAATLTGTGGAAGVRGHLNEMGRKLESALLGSSTGAIDHTMTCLVVAHDDAAGRMFLEDDRLRIRWPGLGRQTPFTRAGELIRRAAKTLGGTYVPNPVWNDLTDHNVVTGHPLGGCVMADDAARGVVNHTSQVYDGARGTSVYPGLYVMDGAVIPRSLGVNPLFTISAMAERSCHHLAWDRGWTIPYGFGAGAGGGEE